MPQPAQPQNPHTWAVTGEEEEPIIGEDGRPTTLHHVQFKTNVGHTSTITLPDSHYTAANVAEQIHYKAGEMLKVHNMNSTNAPRPEQTP